MQTYESNSCSTARQELSSNPDGTHWEHFYLEGQYRFSNQIPNRESFTTGDPGKLFYERGQCRWGVDNPSDMAQPNTASMNGEGLGAAGILLLAGIVAAGVMAWRVVPKDETATEYHPMADAPPLPWVHYNQAAAAAAAADKTVTESAAADTTTPTDTDTDSQQESEASEGKENTAPWDEPSATVADGEPTEKPDTVQPGSELPKGGLDKLKGMSLKTFKDQLAAHGISSESGEFKSVELLNYPGTESILDARMRKFWMEFSSRRVPHAVYFIFGLQDGGGRSPAFKQKYETAKVWVQNWFKENLPSE